MEDQLLLPKAVKGGFTETRTQARQFGKFGGGGEYGGGRWYVRRSIFQLVNTACANTW